MADSTTPAITVSRATAILLSLALLGCAEEPTVPQEPLPPGPPASLSVAPADTIVLSGSSVQLSVSVVDSAGSPVDSAGLVWETSDSTVAVVTVSGLLTGVSPGTAVVRARLLTLVDSVSVTVVTPIGSVALVPPNPGIVPGARQELVIDALDDTGSVVDRTPLRWSSTDPSVATVDSVGVITAVAPGSATITAEFLETEATAEVDVKLVRYTSVSVAVFTSCGVTDENEVWCWGLASSAPIGDGTEASLRTLPVRITSDQSFAAVSAAWRYACSLTTAGKAYCWGFNSVGELGNGTLEDALSPQAVVGDHTFTQISAGDGHACAVTSVGEAFCWGLGEALGDGVGANVSEPVMVSGGLTFDRISAGLSSNPHTCGLTNGGTAYCWGRNFQGQIGDSTLNHASAPTPVSGGLVWAELSAGRKYNCGIASDDLAYCWGHNAFRALGLGFVSTRELTPQPVADGHTYKFIKGRYWHTCAVGTDDVSYCWGEGAGGKLGDGGETSTAFPSPVAGGLTFVVIEPGHSHTCGLATDGRVYCWGSNNGVDGGVLGAGPIPGDLSLTPILVSGQK